MHHIVANLSYVGNGAVAFGERERIAIFSVALRETFCGRKEWIPIAIGMVFRLGFLFLFVQAKRKEK